MKKLIGNRGSVLFIVVMIMSILIIAASATYYVVSANRKNVEVHYGDEQSYQTALSVNDAVSGYIDSYLISVSKSSGRLDGAGKNTLVESMIKLAVGNSMNTSDTSLQSLGLGDYNVVITKKSATPSGTNSENVLNTFYITTTAEVDGETTKVTQIKTIETGPTSYFSRFFTSTGHIANDVVLAGQHVETTIYLENEYTRFIGSNTDLRADLVSSGSVEVEGIQYSSTKPINITIANNFVTTAANGYNICDAGGVIKVGGYMSSMKNIDADLVYVLGDFTIDNGQTIKEYSKVYVGGDCYLKNNAVTKNVTFYINGNLIAEGSSGVNSLGTFYVGKAVSGPNAANVNTKTTIIASPWAADDVSSIALDISNTTGRQTYEKWDAESYFTSNFPTAPEITPNLSANGYATISQSSILHPATLQGWNKDTLIIDATSSDLYFLLKPTSGTVFSFQQNPSLPMNIVVKGSHAVVFVLPDGISFKAGNQSFIGHIGWVELVKNNYTASTDAQIYSMCDGIAGYFQSKRSTVTTKILSQLNADGIVNTNIVSKTDRTANPFYTHNNIFLVTRGGGTIDFTEQQSMFFGYIYTPKSIMKLNTTDDRFAFLGGSIVGTYNFSGDFGVVFTLPYDYYGLYTAKANYNPSNYIRYLMNDSGGGASYSSTNGLKAWNTIGYK